jgi:hypothetical protein
MANIVLSSPIFVTSMIEEIRSSETSVLTGATRRHIPEDDIFHSRRRKKLKSYIVKVLSVIEKARCIVINVCSPIFGLFTHLIQNYIHRPEL